METLGSIKTYKVTKDSKYALINHSHYIEIWSFEQNSRIFEISPQGYINRIELSPDENYIFGANDSKGEIYVWDLKTGDELYSLESTRFIAAQFTPDSRYIVAEEELRTYNQYGTIKAYKFSILDIEKGVKIAETSKFQGYSEYRVFRNSEYFAVGIYDVILYDLKRLSILDKY